MTLQRLAAHRHGVMHDVVPAFSGRATEERQSRHWESAEIGVLVEVLACVARRTVSDVHGVALACLAVIRTCGIGLTVAHSAEEAHAETCKDGDDQHEERHDVDHARKRKEQQR